MKKQRKTLSTYDKNMICKFARSCEDCPLSIQLISHKYKDCYTMVYKLEEQIKKFWNEEIEVDE